MPLPPGKYFFKIHPDRLTPVMLQEAQHGSGMRFHDRCKTCRVTLIKYPDPELLGGSFFLYHPNLQAEENCQVLRVFYGEGWAFDAMPQHWKETGNL